MNVKYFLILIGCLSVLSCSSSSESDMLVIAHRGASAYLPEHTLPAKALAYGMQPDYIEQDVVLTKDDIPIVIHDICLETTTNVEDIFPDRKREDGKYYVIDFTWEELSCLNVSERFDAQTKQPVYKERFPIHTSYFKLHRLSDEIEMIQGLNKTMKRDVGIYVEIKEPQFHRNEGKDISKIVLELLSKYGYTTQQDLCVLQCFDAVELKKIRKNYLSDLFLVQLLEIGYLDEEFRNKTPQEIVNYIADYANGIGPWYKQILEGKNQSKIKDFDKIVQLAHEQHLKVHAFTFRADDLADFKSYEALLQKAEELELDGIFTDHPDLAVSYFKKKNR
ncbi:glycerophosphodiester phosphodiesterase [Ochrovirga pacifica]|uniref:glycerophosphodiester phosphodiesterase n=1 Tax=Ochrovirga pacifica TaxID=1042376 RepID=UPI0002558E5B|nr:glycerophosphodiester phosphodiesterase [Ochrovirga pacifica]